MPFEFRKLSIDPVMLVVPKSFGDGRGFFMETYKKTDFIQNGICDVFLQDNHSRSSKGVLRGLHYQRYPKPQSKFVRCISGEVFDVAVDIRVNSPTFGAWVGEILSEENKKMLYIPEGFAHGFVVLSDIAELVYKASSEFAPECDAGVAWNDPDIAVDWGIDFTPLLSDKDKVLPSLNELKLRGELL